MSARQNRPNLTLERISTEYAVVGAGMVDAIIHTIRPTSIEVQQWIDEGGVKVIVRGPVVNDNGDETGQDWNASWYDGAGFAPEFLARFPLSAAPLWVREKVAQVVGGDPA
jgi:hypothetical protein